MSNTDSLKKQTAVGVVWNSVERFSTLFLNILCTAIVARFLSPEDFGVIGMLVIFTSIGQALVDSGFKTALIREKKNSDDVLSSVFYFNILIGVFIYILLFALSPLISDFYNLPLLSDVAKITFLTIPLSSFGIIQMTILSRAMDFKKLAMVTIVSCVLSGIVGIIVAVTTKNVWAIVFQNVSLYGFRSIALWVSTTWYPKLFFSWNAVMKIMKFSLNLLGANLIGTFFNELNSLLIGKFHNATDLGYYSQANKLSCTASHTFTSVVTQVTYPAMLRVADSNELLKDAYKKCIQSTVLYVGLMTMLLGGVSDEIFLVLYGRGWENASLYFKILCCVGALYPLHSINQNILLLKGKAKTILYLEIVRRSLFLIMILCAVRYDVVYMVYAMALYSFALIFVNLPICGLPINYSLKDQLKDITPLYFTLAIVLLVETLIPPFTSFVIINLLVKMLVGLVTFTVFSYFICKKELLFVLNLAVKIVK